jgi:hypothetical protein
MTFRAVVIALQHWCTAVEAYTTLRRLFCSLKEKRIDKGAQGTFIGLRRGRVLEIRDPCIGLSVY